MTSPLTVKNMGQTKMEINCIYASNGFSIQHHAQGPLGASGYWSYLEHSTERKATLTDAETEIRLKLLAERRSEEIVAVYEELYRRVRI